MKDYLQTKKSQSPQTGQFNSYPDKEKFNQEWYSIICLNPLKRVNSILTQKICTLIVRMTSTVSIPSNGSIQFLPILLMSIYMKNYYSLNPLKRVNSILTLTNIGRRYMTVIESQSPQTGQFNSYGGQERRLLSNYISLNPLKRVNSILTVSKLEKKQLLKAIESQSPQTGQFNSYKEYYGISFCIDSEVSIPSNGSIQFLLEKGWFPAVRSNGTCLNPLKRVNSILTEAWIEKATEHLIVSIPSNGSIQFLPY